MRIIAHLDMDAFFASIEERDRPRLKGLPIVVGADPEEGLGRGVVSTANYKAREYGIRSAMPISKAWRLSEAAKMEGKPGAVFLKTNFENYEKASRNIRTIIELHAKAIEQTSIDEMYFDLSQSGSWEKAAEICRTIKREIEGKERLTASVGLAPNKLVAKIASDMEKPNGLTIVKESGVENFLAPLSVRAVPGIGPKTEEELLKMGIRKVGDLSKMPKSQLKDLFGKWGEDLYLKARGKDDSPVEENGEAKSIGKQRTFSKDILDPIFVIKEMNDLSEEVFEAFKESGFEAFRSIVITVRFFDFETKTVSQTLKELVSSSNDLAFEAVKLLMPFFDKRRNPESRTIRLLGLRVEKLELSPQKLF